MEKDQVIIAQDNLVNRVQQLADKAKIKALDIEKEEVIDVNNHEENDEKSVLKKMKYPQQDLFIADFYNIQDNIFSDVASLEFPIFALKSSNKVRSYKKGDLTLEIQPSFYGTPTVHDADVWIYAVSKLIHAINRGDTIQRVIRFRAYDFLISTNRDKSQKEYERLLLSLERLQGAVLRTTHQWKRIDTKAKSGPIERTEELIRSFHLMESFAVIRDKHTERMDYIYIKLPEWLFEAVEQLSVLKLSPDYFRILSPLNRRLYELARKHCGNQESFQIRLENLKEKTGSNSSLEKFRYQIKQLTNKDLPDYRYSIDPVSDIVTIEKKN